MKETRGEMEIRASWINLEKGIKPSPEVFSKRADSMNARTEIKRARLNDGQRGTPEGAPKA